MNLKTVLQSTNNILKWQSSSLWNLVWISYFRPEVVRPISHVRQMVPTAKKANDLRLDTYQLDT